MKTNEVLDCIKRRRSIRTYTNRQISEEDMKKTIGEFF